jgi:hypothetical protein
MRKPIFTLLLAITFYNAIAQDKKYTTRDYASKPCWIEMINDTSANYFEVEKAFSIYFQHHEMPEAEHDVIGEISTEERKISKREMRKRQAEDAMRMELKKYEHWRFQMQPYVQEDGTILSPSKRLEIWRDGNSK